MVTLKQIAEEAGVSVMTVSNVINKNYSKVSEKTIERVNQIIKKRHYVPNLSARSLSAKKTHIIAVFLHADINEPKSILDDPYNQQMIGLIELELRKKGYYVMLRSYQNAKEVTEMYYNWSIAGAVMFYPDMEEKEVADILSIGVPTVIIDRYYESLDPMTVDLDDYRGGYIPGKFLLANGHKEIAFACPYTNLSTVVGNRIAGFTDALKEHNLTLKPEFFFGAHHSYANGREIGNILAWMNPRPTAIVTTLDRLAVGILDGLRTNGISVPEDMSVIGFDDMPILDFIQPKLTTIAQNFVEKAHHVVSLLLAKINDEPITRTHITLDVRLVERQTVRSLRGGE